MYVDYDYSDDSDCSFDYSDFEYNTIEPYNYELDTFKIEVEETNEEKLLRFIQSNDILEIKSLMPSLMKLEEKSEHINNCEDNNFKNIAENGDIGSDNSDDEYDDDDENKMSHTVSQNKYKEIILKNGDTPLMASAYDGNCELISYFLSLGYDINYKLQNSNKTALLSLFCKINSSISTQERDSETISKLLNCLQIIINAGGDVKAKCYINTADYGNTALHYVAQNNYWEFMNILIHAGADVDAMNNQKITPLQIAASKGHVQCCNILLLAGANAKLVDKSGNTAADLADLEGHNHLSDVINVYCGTAQSNVRLYQTWRQYVANFKISEHESSFNDIVENITHNHSCIESFCLALDAPYLSKLMKDQGISINDLKFMDELKLQELGVPAADCENLIIAMKDLNKKTKANFKKVNFSYGKPLKPITILEMLGNIGEHVELIETNLESMFCHLNRNEKFYLEKYRIINKSTVDNLKSKCRGSIDATVGLIKHSENLKSVINKQLNQGNGDVIRDTEHPIPAIIDDTETSSKNSSFLGLSIFVTSILTLSVGVAIISKRFLLK